MTYRSHNDLGDTASEVTPSTHESVGSTDNFLDKHTRGPELTHNEGCSTKSDEETKD